jgi:cell wall assembly regulator SMI1
MTSIAQSWRRIEIWLQTFAPMCAALLHPGATPEEIAETETRLGQALPEDIKASYQIHNGAAVSDKFKDTSVARFCPLKDMIGYWQWHQDLAKESPEWVQRQPIWVRESHIYPFQPAQPVSWHPAWLPLTGTVERDLLCVDLAPLPGGHVGQILDRCHEVGPFYVPFTSFEEFLSTYADLLEAGISVVEQPLLHPRQDWRTNNGRMPFHYLKERHAAFQHPSPAKPALLRALRSGWYLYYENDGSTPTYEKLFGGTPSVFEQAVDACISLYRTILQMDEATQDDRFFAYYGLASLYLEREEFTYQFDDSDPVFLEEWEAEASNMPSTHWVHYEVALWKRGLLMV